MNGGSVETDYDVICRCPDGATLIERHGREMLVLTDSSWAGRFITSPRGEVVIVQPFGVDEDLGSFIARCTDAPPSETLRFTVVDRRLRLLPGADDGHGSVYGFVETEVTPGVKTCDIWYGPDAQIVVLRPVG
jgi:hypothetical protein